jgi:hypothetical protein
MIFGGQNKSLVAKLRVRGEGLETVSARLNLERLFGASDFLPAGLPPQAIVCIKKISDPKPRTLRLYHADLRFSSGWTEAISQKIENFYRRAFRPLRETVPAQAESVVFADSAELLACLASDFCRGTLAENWWWRGLFPNLGGAQTVAKIWLESAEIVPAAFQLLSRTGEARRFVKNLHPTETEDLVRKIIKIFGLRKLAAALFEPFEAKGITNVEKQFKSPKKEAQVYGLGSNFPTKIETAFGSLVPETDGSDLSFQQQCLLAAGLLLARSPKQARSAGFARRAKLFRLKNESGKTIAGKKNEELFDQNAGLDGPVKTVDEKRGKARPASEPQTIKPKRAKTEIRFLAEQSVEKRSGQSGTAEIELKKTPELPEKSTAAPEKFAETGKKTPKIEFETPRPQKKVERSGQMPAREHKKDVKPADVGPSFRNFWADFENDREFSFQTRFGGVFYLLNLGLYFGLYRDFTESLESEIELNIWDFIALLALEFLGERIKTDAVWDFLKMMAEGGEGDDFGAEFNQLQDWRMPLRWLETFPKDQQWFFVEKGKRLVVRHAEGFNVVDVWLRGDFETQLEAETGIYQKYFTGIVSAGKKDPNRTKSKKWLKNLAEYLQKRLFRALNRQTAKELNAILFARKAEVTVSATHLEITFGLADLPFEVRFAGIDRDPGWIPAAGKFVYFHFV